MCIDLKTGFTGNIPNEATQSFEPIAVICLNLSEEDDR